MPFKVDTSKVEGQELFPPGIYEIKLISFKPQKASKGTSTSLNALMEVTNHPDFSGRKLYDTLNEGGAWLWPDFVHCFGLPMETDGESYWIPGEWDGDKIKYKADDPSTWVYKGPLISRTGKAEIAVADNTKGRDVNKIKRYFCAITDCATKFPKVRHQEDLLRKQK